ncbi:MAG TPA: HEAT repeat domain-containing protein [Chthonomonadaceae bacterium]|nr:HEAT repeat domain-containing protein [Chthonomonadaceae bacterium]
MNRKTAQLIQNLTTGDVVARREAATKLGKRGGREAVEALCQALQDGSWHVRRNAAQALGRLGDTAVLEPLCQALQDKSQGVRRAAATALGALQDARAVEPLLSALRDKKALVRNSACEALIRIGLPAVAPLCQALAEDREPVRKHARTALQQILEQNHKQTLSALLGDARLTPQQRWIGLDALCGYRGGRFLGPYFADTRRFCERVARSEDFAEPARTGAHEVLNYLTLARPSQRDLSAEKDSLLRAAHGTEATGGADILLRASNSEPEELTEERALRSGALTVFAYPITKSAHTLRRFVLLCLDRFRNLFKPDD